MFIIVFYANTYCGYNNIHYLHENRLTFFFERLTLSDERGRSRMASFYVQHTRPSPFFG